MIWDVLTTLCSEFTVLQSKPWDCCWGITGVTVFIVWLVNSVVGGGNYKCNWSWVGCNAGLRWPTGIPIDFQKLTSPCANFKKSGNNCLWFNHADTRMISCQLSLMAPACSSQKNDNRPWWNAIGSALQTTGPSVDPIMWHTETIASSG